MNGLALDSGEFIPADELNAKWLPRKATEEEMSKLTDFELHALYSKAFSDKSAEGIVTAGIAALRAIEAAATEPLLQRIAELEDSLSAWRRNAELADQANRELERQLEEARKQALEDAAVECDKRAHAGDAGALMAARAIRALKGAKE